MVSESHCVANQSVSGLESLKGGLERPLYEAGKVKPSAAVEIQDVGEARALGCPPRTAS